MKSSSLPTSPLHQPPRTPLASAQHDEFSEQTGAVRLSSRPHSNLPSPLTQPSSADLDKTPQPSLVASADASATDTDETETEDEKMAQKQRRSGKDKDQIEKLRGAVNAQLLLNQQRERLAQQQKSEVLIRGLPSPNLGKKRVSPILEEGSNSPSAPAGKTPALPIPTTSTDSVRTIRGPVTPFTTGREARTPSYPFPQMSASATKSLSLEFHRPFTTLSPTVVPVGGNISSYGAPRDRAISGSVTPASTVRFLPPGVTPNKDNPAYPSPNLYDLTLALNSEPGLDPWWTNVVHIMRDCFKAERLTLAVPADTTDLENVPWGQKATFNATEEDGYSLTYLQHESNQDASLYGTEGQSSEGWSEFDVSRKENNRLGGVDVPAGSETSTSGSDEKKTEFYLKPGEVASETNENLKPSNVEGKFSLLSEVQAQESATPSAKNLTESIEQRAASEQSHFPIYSDIPGDHESRGRVFSVLQALDFEAEPLIESSGVIKVLERGKVVVLSREYTEPAKPTEKGEADVDNKKTAGKTRWSSPPMGPPDATKFARSMSQAAETRPRSLSLLSSKGGSKHGRSGSRGQGSDTSKLSRANGAPTSGLSYSEYEQFPSSPWSQSPAPSPAIRSDPTENPFFAGAKVDEDSFNPTDTPQDYSIHQEVEAIGIDRASTVIHIPLIHPLLSKPFHQSRIGSTSEIEPDTNTTDENMQSRQFVDVHKGSIAGINRDKRSPIAILSILTQVIPYPSNLIHSLTHLAPHLATSFSLSRHYTNIELEAAGLQQRRHAASNRYGLGAGVAVGDTQQAETLSHLDELVQSSSIEEGHFSANGSVTSPSDYSGVSKSSPGGSLAGTPGWDPASFGMSNDSRSAVGTPAHYAGSEAVDSYFASRRGKGPSRANSGVVPTIGSLDQVQNRQASQSPVSDRKQLQTADSTTHHGDDGGMSPGGNAKIRKSEYPEHPMSEEDPTTPKNTTDVTGEPVLREDLSASTNTRDDSASYRQSEQLASQRRPIPRPAGPSTTQRPHSLLHSYGADFNATFQSLASTSSVPRQSRKSHARSGSAPAIGLYEMPPPSERLLRTIIDSIPVQIFTAAPQTGAITWVNSRFLTYRGQTVEDFMKAPWQSIHESDREEYVRLWGQALRNGEQFSHQVRIRRFDGAYRWFYVRAAPLRDTRGLTVHWFGTNMDIHEQHLAEMDLARQKETAASEAKYRALANSSPQIVFAATEAEGITFVNTQWLTYSGQKFKDALALGFMDHVHPDDLSKCKLPFLGDALFNTKHQAGEHTDPIPSERARRGSSPSFSESTAATETTVKQGQSQPVLTRASSSDSSSMNIPIPELSELANTGIIKVSRDSDGNPTYSTEVRLRSKEGEYRWHLVRCIIVDSITFGDGECLWFGTCTDINDHKLLEQRLKETMDSKTRFLSNMSHEIRTPLIGISGMVKFLLDTPLSPEQLDYCHTISTSSEGLLLVINDILDLSKVDAGMMKLSYEWFHIRSLIEDANELLSTMAIQKRLELSYIVDEDVPSVVKGDRVRLRQVLLNVIGNAIKFTSTGEVFSHCQISQDRAEGSNEMMLSFEVTDTGPGFSEKEAELIFKPFSQIDGSSTRQHGGSGLGLVISRQLVELHGGKLKGTSVQGKGSTFLFTAKFLLPSENDSPISPITQLSRGSSATSDTKRPRERDSPSPVRSKGFLQAFFQSPFPPSPTIERGQDSPAAPASSGSSDPSVRSYRSQRSDRSSISSFNPLPMVLNQEPTTMKLALPPLGASRAEATSVPPAPPSSSETPKPPRPVTLMRTSRNLHPPLYSILNLCEQPYSREATARHIATTLPKDIPHQITSRGSLADCQKMIAGDDPVIFTHIIVNVSDADEIISLINHVFQSTVHAYTTIVILSDPIQRTEILQLAPEYDFDELDKAKRVQFVYKPIKPSRFAVIFDPELERDLSTDRNRSSAQRVAESQKQVFVDMEKTVGNKGHRVLLVEDNPVNQKVLLKFLGKVGLHVETALDGIECTEKVFNKPHEYYSVILCDLHMPRKDGYQTCREIRHWERKNKSPQLPIIALSANVMADVVDKCIQAGFNSYVTKPVDFKELSKAMTDLLDPADLMHPPLLLHRS